MSDWYVSACGASRAQADAIKGIGKFFGPVRPDVKGSSVSGVWFVVRGRGRGALRAPPVHPRVFYVTVCTVLYVHARVCDDDEVLHVVHVVCVAGLARVVCIVCGSGVCV